MNYKTSFPLDHPAHHCHVVEISATLTKGALTRQMLREFSRTVMVLFSVEINCDRSCTVRIHWVWIVPRLLQKFFTLYFVLFTTFISLVYDNQADRQYPECQKCIEMVSLKKYFHFIFNPDVDSTSILQVFFFFHLWQISQVINDLTSVKQSHFILRHQLFLNC